MTDDQRAAGTLAVMPETRRWFAQGGTTFTRAFATTPLCCPSRASFMTGRYAHNHEVLTNKMAANLNQSETIQRYLDDAGYRTALIGKYLNGWELGSRPPHFDHFAMSHDGYYGADFNVNGRPRKVRGYATDFIARQATSFLRSAERDDATPWFLLITTRAPHSRAVPEHGYAAAQVPRFRPNPAMLEKARRDKPAYVREEPVRLEGARVRRRNQLLSLKSVDDLVGDVFDTMRSTGEDRETLAIFTSDNGFTWEEHGLSLKGIPYVPSVRIPLAVRWPGHVAAGQTSRMLVANIDVAPTVLDAAGIPSAHTMDGRSLLSGISRDRLLLEGFGSTSRPELRWASTITRSHQYVEYFAEGSTTPIYREFYNLREDPWQLRNLLGDRSEVNDPETRALSARLAEDGTCAGSTCP